MKTKHRSPMQFLSIAITLLIISMSTQAQTSHALTQELAPTGTLRASINLGNPILANKDDKGQPFGVSIDLATELAKRLNVPLSLVVFETAGQSVDAVTNEKADFGFFAIDPVRGQGIAFTGPYVLIEGSYLVTTHSPLTHNDQVDKKGVRIAVGKGSAYDLFLTREIKNAEIQRAPSSPTTVDFFLSEKLEVAAGVKQQLEMDAKRLPNLRLLPGRFMVIEQAMGLPKSRSPEAQAYLKKFVEEMKISGFVTQALKRHNIQGAVVAHVSSN